MHIVWSPALETGHRQIDLQHQELVEMLNELLVALDSGSEFAALNDILPRLNNYVLFHFGTEEMLMPGLPPESDHAASHCRAHRDFTARVNALRIKVASGERPDAGPLADFLRNWLIDHIQQTDRELITLLAAGQPRPLSG
ncbi:MAG: bacteriohemerythrin [Betaproteobacteria bacterium]|nr:bacteriohemerythrin [Betaproteobacteria bacterium]MCL2885511.1 bacteriohemerythrin [Betaproteobacteria bacterium]